MLLQVSQKLFIYYTTLMINFRIEDQILSISNSILQCITMQYNVILQYYKIEQVLEISRL
ncbi:unnamed protein product [Paramecium sonneborni]|uniref:Uncharacterized protein n=1 Tax=Paramecium sonneborni TaxID=65129 RepID=A0A8S1RDV5_9CILI|nr:unnamed protein product [Paramecium sonneborni]